PHTPPWKTDLATALWNVIRVLRQVALACYNSTRVNDFASFLSTCAQKRPVTHLDTGSVVAVYLTHYVLFARHMTRCPYR
ncbi:MAG: hypothetical protein ACPL7K_09145, partial [Armatimonadota bacterium]